MIFEIANQFLSLGINFATFFAATALAMIIIDKDIFVNKWNLVIPIAIGTVAHLAFLLYDPNKTLELLSIPSFFILGIITGVAGRKLRKEGSL